MKRRRLVLLLPLVLAACGYNTIQKFDEQASAAQGQIEVQLQRRADLVPSLVATVKGLANQELAVFSEVARARSGLLGAVQSKDAEQMANANQAMNGALGRLIAVAEAYPQLKSDQAFLKLQDELAGTENRIAVARTRYNAAVQDYNVYIQQFPNSIWANMSGYHVKNVYYSADQSSRQAPKVDFSNPK